MPRAKMQWAIFVEDDNHESVIHVGPVPPGEYHFLRDRVLPTLRPLTDEEYMQGPAVILHTFARYSYVLFKDDVYWCVEWAPGLVVVRFSADGTMAWSAIRSPNPGFGGRQPTKEDLELFDEDAEDHRYNLVFRAWDAQFEEIDRRSRSFVVADATSKKKFWAALAHVNSLGATMETRYSKGQDKWAEICKSNLEKWCGDGIRLH